MSMSVPLSRIVTFAVAILVLGAAATASAAPKKNTAKAGAERTTTSATMCDDGTPIIMQGLDCPRRPARGEHGAEAANPARGTPPRHPARQQRSLRRVTSAHTVADADPAVGGSLHSAAGQ